MSTLDSSSGDNTPTHGLGIRKSTGKCFINPPIKFRKEDANECAMHLAGDLVDVDIVELFRQK